MPVFEFGSGDENLGGDIRAWKAKEGEKYMISMVWWPGSEEMEPNLDAASPKFSGGMRHFVPNAGYVMNDGPEYTKLIGKKPSTSIVTIIVVWPLDSRGKASSERILGGEAKVLPWVFSKQKYGTLKERHGEFPLGEHDLKITCEDTKFQKLDIGPTKSSLIRQLQSAEKYKEVLAQILTQVKALIPTIDSHMGREISLDELREAMGLAVSAPADSLSSDVEIDDLIDGI